MYGSILQYFAVYFLLGLLALRLGVRALLALAAACLVLGPLLITVLVRRGTVTLGDRADQGFEALGRSRGPAPGADRGRPLPRGRVVRVLLPRDGDRSAGPRRSAVDRTPGRGRPRGGWPRDLRRVDRGPHLPPESPRVVAPLERHGPLRGGRVGDHRSWVRPGVHRRRALDRRPGSAHASLASRRSSRSARWR